MKREPEILRQRTNEHDPGSHQRRVMPPEAGMDFGEFCLRCWHLQGAEFTVKNAMGEMRVDGAILRVLMSLDDLRQGHNEKGQR